MTPVWALDVAIAPEGAIARVTAGINRRPKRAFGVLKTQNEYVGLVRGAEFEIWERNQRAIHAIGRIRGRRGGSRIELRFVLPARTRVLIVGFFGLYAVVAGGLALRGPDASFSATELAAAVAGAAALGFIFAASAWRQRTNLRTFVERLFGDIPRI